MKTLVWGFFPSLSLEMFREKILVSMRNTIGKTLKVDMTTFGIIRGRFARVCVELDLNRPLMSTVMIMGQVVQVKYEGPPKICYQCGYYGNMAWTYPKNVVPMETAGESGEKFGRSTVEQSKPKGPYGL